MQVAVTYLLLKNNICNNDNNNNNLCKTAGANLN